MRRWGSVCVAAGLYVWIAELPRAEAWLWQGAFGGLFLLYIIANWGRPWPLGQLLAAGILLRLLCFFGPPLLSDDFYRFLWDGLLLQKGVHPMLYTPEAYASTELSAAESYLREHMNSPTYLSPYPAVHQLVFYFSTLDYVGVAEAIFRMRCLHLAAEIGIFFLLLACCRQYRVSVGAVGWYFLHPMAILEGVAHLHFEPYVLLFLLLTCWALKKKQWRWAGTGLALAVGTKLLPLILLPYILLRLYYQQSIRACRHFLGCFLGVVGLLFVPLGHPDLWKVHKSIFLYFHNFEFNASLYFLLKGLIKHVLGYASTEWLGPVLAILAAIGITGISIGAAKRPSLAPAGVMLLLFTWYFACATTVHPWYLLPLMGLGALSTSKWPLLWGYLVLLSYVGYSPTGYTHPYMWITVEYTVLLGAAWYEWKMRLNAERGLNPRLST